MERRDRGDITSELVLVPDGLRCVVQEPHWHGRIDGELVKDGRRAVPSARKPESENLEQYLHESEHRALIRHDGCLEVIFGKRFRP